MEASDWNETSELKYLTHWMPLPSPPDDVAAPAEQQADPKTAPGEPDKLMRYCLALLESFDYEDDEDSQSKAFFNAHINADWFFHVKHSIERQLEAKAAHQQEAQEPYAYAVYFPDQPKVELVHELDELTDDLTNRPHAVTKLYTAPQPAPAAQGDAIEHELAMLIRRIVSSARRNCEDGSNVLKLANEAWAYLVRKGLNGSPLRDAGIESDPTPPAKAADSVLEDAACWHWIAEYLVGTRTDLDDEIVASKTVNDLRKLVEATIKQGGKA